MGVDNSTLLRNIAFEIAAGLEAEDGPGFDELVCTVKDRVSITGTEPVRANEDMSPRQVAEQNINDDPVEVGFNLGSVDWTLGMVSRKTTLSEAQMNDLGQYMDVVGDYVRYLRKTARMTREGSLKTAMGDFADVAATGGAWSTSASKPVSSIQNAIEASCPGCDTIVIGRVSALELARHADVKEFLSNYPGDGAMEMGSLKQAIANIAGIDAGSVHVWNSWYNSVEEGQAQTTKFTKANIAGDYFAGYVKRGLQYIRQPSATGPMTVETDHKKTALAWTEYFDHVCVGSTLGFELTSI